ncbi:MAG: HD domain-containing protein [Deltaproteobacteria bacterium]|nr:HD domain-containing protein [Deltaproteobacteria bacterium]MBW1961937.1 HD domain-containing protein [Deltaproteobacteria bacterium]MBW2151871.1 HD domain-containing protein [Deltaproteobacteria bacterium]
MKNDDPLIETVRDAAKTIFSGSRGSHDWEHTLRVCKLCQRIGAVEEVDRTVLLAAAYLHDIGRYDQDRLKGRVCHAEKGAQMARPIIAPLALKQSQKENILHCIRAHRFRGNHVPETAEARVLFDADKLDAIGAVGVARAFLFAGEVGARLHNPDARPEDTLAYTHEDTGYREYRVKLCKIKDRMLTAEGKRIAEARHAFMQRFFERFLMECEGED